MTTEELIRILKKLPKNGIIRMYSDAEGNDIKGLSRIESMSGDVILIPYD